MDSADARQIPILLEMTVYNAQETPFSEMENASAILGWSTSVVFVECVTPIKDMTHKAYHAHVLMASQKILLVFAQLEVPLEDLEEEIILRPASRRIIWSVGHAESAQPLRELLEEPASAEPVGFTI